MNRTLFAADCLEVLNDSSAISDASIDLIYLDPPFNSNSKYNLPFKGRDKTHKPVEAFVDIWKWSDQDAESLGRKWIGIDMRGTPDSVAEARVLARQDPFEFEKWVCGFIGAEGMFREPGERGVDGVLKFFPVREGKKMKAEYAIVQVKGGNVSPDSVKALHETVRRYEATAGVMVCFAEQLGTVENQRVKATFSDAWGSYPVIQGFSVESLLNEGELDLPLYGYKRRGAMLGL